MRYFALATDYDGTIAKDGVVNESTKRALRRLRDSGRKLILVTGRELPELLRIFPEWDLFDRIVAENGALLFRPASREERLLATAPPGALVNQLRARGVTQLSVGRVIVSTVEPNEALVLPVIRELGLEMQVIFNKGAVMVLPSGINKATGLAAALEELRLSPHNVVAVGDAENDHALIQSCECGAAVGNGLLALRAQADIVTRSTHGEGVAELIEALVTEDLQSVEPKLFRHELSIGNYGKGGVVRVKPYGETVLVVGGVAERQNVLSKLVRGFQERKYQVCVINPAGDHTIYGSPGVFGSSSRPPSVESFIRALEAHTLPALVNLLAVPVAQRPEFFLRLFRGVVNLRAQLGRPHWIVIDSTEELWPLSYPLTDIGAKDFQNVAMAVENPGNVAPDALRVTTNVLVVGGVVKEGLRRTSELLGYPAPELSTAEGEKTGAAFWSVGKPSALWFVPEPTEGLQASSAS